jgi:hypothetical protein
MFCFKCGVKLNEGVKFCSECGITIAVEEPTPIPAQEQLPQQQQYTRPQQSAAPSIIQSLDSIKPSLLERPLQSGGSTFMLVLSCIVGFIAGFLFIGVDVEVIKYLGLFLLIYGIFTPVIYLSWVVWNKMGSVSYKIPKNQLFDANILMELLRTTLAGCPQFDNWQLGEGAGANFRGRFAHALDLRGIWFTFNNGTVNTQIKIAFEQNPVTGNSLVFATLARHKSIAKNVSPLIVGIINRHYGITLGSR